MKRRFTILLAALLLMFSYAGFAQVESGTTYSTPSISGLPEGWSGVDGDGTTYVKLIDATHYIQTADFEQNGFSSIVIKARKFGGPSEAQAKITVSWYDSEEEETVLGTIDPTSTTLTNYTISNPATTENGTGYIKIQNKNASSNKGSGVSEVTITYVQPGGTQPTTYTVTYDCNGGTSGCPNPSTLTVDAGSQIELADAPSKDGFDFAGWSDGNTTYDENEDYTVNGNVTFTAQWTEQSSGDVHWVLTSLADLTESDVFVIVGNGYAMTNNNGTSSAPAVSAVTIENDMITSTVASTIQWTISGNASDGYTFYPNGSTTTWLYCNTTAESSSNNNMRVGTGDRKVFELNSNNILLTKDSYITRYLSIYNNQDWRGYVNTNLSPALSFYKKVTGDIIPPSISADNVSLAYDDEEGTIAYTINNEPTPAGTLTATTTAEWLTIGTVGDNVPFTCTANDATTERTATVTLTYTYERATVTKDVTVTQAAAPVVYTTIPALFEAATSTETSVLVTFNNWVVSGVSTNGKNVFVTDNNGNGFVIFDTEGGLDDTYSVGDILAGTAVSCSLVLYHGFVELTDVNAENLTITAGGDVTEADVAMADLAGVNTGALVHYENLTCSIDNNKYYLSDGTTTIQVYNTLYAFEALEDGKTYNITGVYQQYNSNKEILPRSADDIEEVVVIVPSITVTPPTLNVDAEQHLVNYLDLEYENIEVEDAGSFTVHYYNAEGEEIELVPGETWMTAGVAKPENAYQVICTIIANEGAARTAYFKVSALDAENNTVYSNLVTVNQEAYVAPTGDKYAKVTSAEDLTNGQYLIVYEDGDVAFNGGLDVLDVENNTIDVTINEDEITATNVTSAAEFTIDITAGTIKSASGYYIGQNSNANGLASSTTVEYTNTISIDNEGNAVVVSSGGAYLRYNSASNQNRFRYYKSSSYTAQKAIQLYKKVEATTETYTLEIDGYAEGSEGGYYLIASPVTVDLTNHDMTTGDFDLYYFDNAQDDEWRNYRQEAFNLVPGTGYLYAKKATDDNPTYSFELTGVPYNGNGDVELTYTENADFAGFNLIGNPFNTNATLVDMPYYRLNSDGSALNTSTETSQINVMEGVFVQATPENTTAHFTTAAGSKIISQLNVKVTRNRGAVLDNAIIRFDNGAMLGKFQLNPNSTKVYITEGNEDYAIVRSAAESEMPVSFKAAENGTYTLSVVAENVEMNYLHLIDNMTGTDVDLLATPSYSFEANTTDYANRFRLVFNANGLEENSNFAFFNGSEWVVSNMGDATLQVIDMTGRVISSETVNGNVTFSTNGLTAGVYMMRLVNGNDVKTQKVLVK